MPLLENPVRGGVVKSTVLVDFSWLLRKSYHYYKGMSFRGRPVGHVHGVLDSVGRLLSWAKRSGSRFIFFLDSPTIRDLHVRHYKASRGKGDSHSLLTVDFSIIRDVILSSGLGEFVSYGGFEADDLIYTYSFIMDNPLLWGEDLDLFQSPMLRKYFTNVSGGAPKILDIMDTLKGKDKGFLYSESQVNIPFLLLAALGKPSNNMPVAIRRNDKQTLKYLADPDCPLRQEVIDKYSAAWGEYHFSEFKFYDSIMNLSAFPGNTKFRENLYCSFPRNIPGNYLEWVVVDREVSDKDKKKALQFLMTNQMHSVLSVWGRFLK